MAGLLIRLFIKDSENTGDPTVRRSCGTALAMLGIAINLLLFLAKLAAGLISGSVAAVADAFNNLSDAGTSIVTLVGFRLGAQEPDPHHPYGHGRYEYISGLLVSVAVLLMGVELLRTGVEKIFRPSPTAAGPVLLAVLGAAILLKLYMAAYNRKYGRLLNSTAMKAAAADSLSDCAATGAVLLSALVNRFTGVDVDGWAGVVVAVFILRTGILSLKETIDPLLGRAPDGAMVAKVYEIVNSHPEALGIHDLIVHDYGPGRLMLTLHVEVDGSLGVYELHDAVDAMERELAESLGCTATIHMDPTSRNPVPGRTLRGEITRILRERVDYRISIHDLWVDADRAVIGFDTVVPRDLSHKSVELKEEICRIVEKAFPGCKAETAIDIELEVSEEK